MRRGHFVREKDGSKKRPGFQTGLFLFGVTRAIVTST
jgi:hypothetical protein